MKQKQAREEAERQMDNENTHETGGGRKRSRQDDQVSDTSSDNMVHHQITVNFNKALNTKNNEVISDLAKEIQQAQLHLQFLRDHRPDNVEDIADMEEEWLNLSAEYRRKVKERRTANANEVLGIKAPPVLPFKLDDTIFGDEEDASEY